METGMTNLSVSTLTVLCKYYKIILEDFFGIAGSQLVKRKYCSRAAYILIFPGNIALQ